MQQANKNTRSSCSFIRCRIHPGHLKQQVKTLFGYFHTLTYQDFKSKQNTKHARSASFSINRMSLHENFTQNIRN